MNFIENILHRIKQTPARPLLREVRDGRLSAISAGEFLALIRQARSYLRQAGLKRGDRCGLLAPNGVRWAAVDLALICEGIIVVPLYPRQAPAELARMLDDCGAAMVCCGSEDLRDGIMKERQGESPSLILFSEIFTADTPGEFDDTPVALADSEVVTIIYTSGTSGEPKGVMLTAGNVTFMLGCVGMRLDQLMEGETETSPDRVFHYLPLCFAGSWILLLGCLSRHSLLTLSTDLNKLGEELKLAEPQYFLNVPTLLERIRGGVESQIAEKPAIIRSIYYKGQAAWLRQYEGKASGLDGFWFSLAKAL
ncbi:MAG: AMP-binding protein, partial [Blastocatellia bacterium]|nr:AMP-binding protein [Blastocatellia bacterium]